MDNFDLKKYLAEGKLLKEELTPLQQYVYDYEKEVSGEDNAKEFLDGIKKLNTPNDVYDYYAFERNWEGDSDLEGDLENIYNQVLDKFKSKNENKMDNFDLKKYLAEGRLFEAIDFPELEDEFEGAMDAMVVEPEVYFQGIIDASAEEIVSDDYYEIMNAVEMGTYSAEEAVKLAKAWAKEKLSNFSEAPRDGVKSAATKLGIKPSHIRKENMYIDDEEFEMEMGRSKKDSLKKEMIMHVDQLMDGNIDMIDFMNVVEEIMLDVKIAAKDEELNKRRN